MDLQLRDKTALVTGASMGIGRAIAKMLAIEGVRVAAVARRVELMEAMADEVVAAGGTTARRQPEVSSWRARCC